MLAPIEGARLLTPPINEPISLDEAKKHLRVDGDDENLLITSLITAARQYVEERCWIALITQTWVLGLEVWPSEPLRLPKTPLLTRPTVLAVRYKDSHGTQQTAASDIYTVLATGEFALVYDQSWPSDLWPQWAIEIEYTVGYGALSGHVPALLGSALKLMIGHLYENREAVVVSAGVSIVSVPLAVNSILSLYEVR